MNHRYRVLVALMGLALSMLLVVPSAGAVEQDPPGNNGTVKIQDAGGSDLPDNDPHVGCVFKVAFFGFDANQEVNFTISAQPPSGTGQVTTRHGTLDENGAGVFDVDLSGLLGGLDRQPNQGYHLQLVDSLTQKSKTFWSGCDPAPPATGSITITKIDQNEQPLAGACFDLSVTPAFMAAQTGTDCTGGNGQLVFSGLDLDTAYTLVETSPPDGCTTTSELPAYLTLTTDQPNQSITVVNDCAEPPSTGSITVKKVDQHGDPLAGVCFNLGLTPSFTAAQSGANCTDETGTLVISGLSVPGTYTLVEESAPENCTTNDVSQDIQLTEQTPDVAVTVTNDCAEKPPTTGSITVTKVDQHGDAIAGVCFNLGQRGFMAAQSGANCTDENGQLVIDGLPVPATYVLVEESAPAGCTTSDVPQDIKLTPAKPDVAVTVTNDCAETPVTPATPVVPEKPVTPSKPVKPVIPVKPAKPAKSPAAVTALPTTGAGAATGTASPALWLLLAGASVLVAGGSARLVADRRRRR